MSSPHQTAGHLSHNHDFSDGHGLPEGSSLFKEVMAELHPPPEPVPQQKSPAPRRRRSVHTRHVHYGVNDDVRAKEHRSSLYQEEGEDEEEEGHGKQILHGKCHCYFVEKGNVTGLADHQCHHEHRFHPLNASPNSSPHLARHQTPSPTHEGSPSSWKNSVHHQHNHHLHHHPHHLLPPDEDHFRARSHSEPKVMSPRPRRASLSHVTVNLSHTKTSSLHASHSQGAGMGGHRCSLQHEKIPPIRRSSSLRHDYPIGSEADGGDDLSHAVGSLSLHHYTPPSILVRDVSDLGAGDSAHPRTKSATRKTSVCKLSTHAVQSDQLHYLYDQFLPPGH